MEAVRRIELERHSLKIWQDSSHEEQIIAVIPITEEEFEQLFSVPDELLLKFYDAGREKGQRESTKKLLTVK